MGSQTYLAFWWTAWLIKWYTDRQGCSYSSNVFAWACLSQCLGIDINSMDMGQANLHSTVWRSAWSYQDWIRSPQKHWGEFFNWTILLEIVLRIINLYYWWQFAKHKKKEEPDDENYSHEAEGGQLQNKKRWKKVYVINVTMTPKI